MSIYDCICIYQSSMGFQLGPSHDVMILYDSIFWEFLRIQSSIGICAKDVSCVHSIYLSFHYELGKKHTHTLAIPTEFHAAIRMFFTIDLPGSMGIHCSVCEGFSKSSLLDHGLTIHPDGNEVPSF